MRLLDRYILRELLLPLACCLGGFLIIFITFDLFNQLADFHKNSLTSRDILEYYLHKAPEFLVASYVMPMSLLLSLLYALTTHSRHNEITAMRAAAISLWRISLPYFAVGLLFSLGVFYVNEQVVPEGVETAERILYKYARDNWRAEAKIWRPNVFLKNDAADRTWRIGRFHMRGGVMLQPHFAWQLADGTRLQVMAEKAWWQDRQWLFTNAEQFVFSAEPGALPIVTKTNQLVVPQLTETPRSIRSEIKIAGVGSSLGSLRRNQFSSAEIVDYLKLHPKLERKKSHALRTVLHSRMAAPWICLVVVLIAVPFGALPGRRNVFVGVASSVFICFAFLIMKDLTLALGAGGFVTPWVAAWLPNALFAGLGGMLMWRIR